MAKADESVALPVTLTLGQWIDLNTLLHQFNEAAKHGDLINPAGWLELYEIDITDATAALDAQLPNDE